MIGGSRKILDAQAKTAEKYFNESFLKKIKKYFNFYNFTHDNLNGEEKYDDKGKITKKFINQELKKFSSDEIFKLCDYLAKFLEIFVAMLKLGDYKK